MCGHGKDDLGRTNAPHSKEWNDEIGSLAEEKVRSEGVMGDEAMLRGASKIFFHSLTPRKIQRKAKIEALRGYTAEFHPRARTVSESSPATFESRRAPKSVTWIRLGRVRAGQECGGWQEEGSGSG